MSTLVQCDMANLHPLDATMRIQSTENLVTSRAPLVTSGDPSDKGD